MSEPSARPVPERLAEFEILRRLGVGGMAEVFLAKKQGAEGTFKLLVVKRILPAHGSSRRFRAMFAEEAQLATRLNHPNIVQVYDFQDYGDEGQLLSMEYVEGPDLRKVMRAAQARGTRIPPFVAAHIIAEVAKGLHYAHERKDEGGAPLDIVHRDVSPQNVLVSYEGAVKIADFGIASANLFREEPGVLKGKTAYMSPEQARGERVDRRTDVYSLGVVFHELLTGRALHGAAEGSELLDAVRVGQVEPPSTFVRDVPGELEVVVMRALARDREDRFPTARELAASITRALFQKQQLVDSHVLESVLSELIGRERTSPGVPLPPATSAHGTPAEAAGEVPAHPGTAGAAEEWRDEQTGTGQAMRGLGVRGREGREVRHVAVVSMNLNGAAELEAALGEGAARSFLEQLRAIFDELAFKHGARWTWDGNTARAVVGLLANPARAAADAAWLAVDVHEAIQGACDHLPVPLRASVGIVRGIATGHRDAAGHLIDHQLQGAAEYLSGLLGGRAPDGATWVAGGLYRLVRRDFIWGDAPTVELDEARNLPKNMRIYALLRPLTREEKLEEMALAPSDLIGRDAELADLQAAYHRAVTPPAAGGGLGQITARVIVGELGIGKTALASAFLAELPPDARILRIECSPARSEVPFSNVAEWIRELTGLDTNRSIEEASQRIVELLGDFASGDHGAEIVASMAELATGRAALAHDEADVAHHRRLVASGVRRFFARAAVEAPLVVLIDGIQWSDRPSLELVSELVRRADPLPVLALLAMRPDDRIAPLVDGLVRIELKGLSSDNQIRLLQARLGATEGVAQVCADLLPRAAGNPFFLLEMVDALLERGSLELREHADGKTELARVERDGETAQPLPSTLEQLIADRLAELPPEEQVIVEWLAVAGGPLPVTELTTLVGGSCDDAVARLCARGLCDLKGDVVDVRHPLTRDVAHLALHRADRVRMHKKLGEYLAGTPLAEGLTAAIVGRHFARGMDHERAAEHYLKAASAARASYQTQLSARYYRRALSLLPEDDLRRLEAHEAVEAICRIQGRWSERRKHLTALRRLAKLSGKPRWVATALLRTARLDLDAGHLARGLSSAQRAEQVARQSGSPSLEIQAELLMAEMLRDLGDMQGALSACDRALETTSRGTVSAWEHADVLRARGTLLRRVGRVDEAIEAHAEAIAIFKQVGARRMEARAKNSLAFALFVMGRYEDAIALALDAIRIDLAIGGRFQIAKTLSNIGQSYARLGDVERGQAYLARAREAHQRYGDQDARADTLLATAEVLLEVGDVAAADTLVGDAGALIAVTGSAYDSVHEKIMRALLARATGDSGSAVMYAFDARQAAEAQAYVAYHFYALAVEAAARVDIGEQHTGILLAMTAMGAIETVQGSEYALETRGLCCDALLQAGSPRAQSVCERAVGSVLEQLQAIHVPELRRSFIARPPIARLLATVDGARARADHLAESAKKSVRAGSPQGSVEPS
ncbi:MAG: protein kinase [Sorangiineae bacterium]|nr:protein kinase [Polyangiaceae bacterium]MEB2321856.1 protein kinase [Sorangiineae bacterium]